MSMITSIIHSILGYNYLTINILCIIGFLIITILWMYHDSHSRSRLYILGQRIPGPKAYPIIGNLWILARHGIKSSQEIVDVALCYAAKYGTVLRAWLGSNLYVFLMEPEDAEVILSSQIHLDKGPEYKFFKPWLGDGLLISNGGKWRSHRKIIAPTFHINILKSFMGVFNQNSKNVVNKMRTEMGKIFDVHDYLSGVTVDILLETAMGITRKTQDESGFDYAMAVMKMCSIIQQRQVKLWMRLDATFKYTSTFKLQTQLLNIIHGLTNKVIATQKSVYQKNKEKGIIPPTLEELTRDEDNNSKDSDFANNSKTLADTVFKGYRDDLDENDENNIGAKKRLAFLDLMLESSQNGTNKLTDREIKEEVDTIMFEGHDTTAAGSSFVLCVLGSYQDIQAKVYDELYQIFGDSDRPCTFADTLEMKYLERVIFETLRLFPPVPVIARKLDRDVTIATNNYIIPAGTTVVVGTFKIHRHPKYYKNPDNFNPDNFLPENTQNRHYYSFIPFSAGPRSCVGRKYALLKLKVLLSTILRNFEVISNVSPDNFKLQGDIILKRSDGFNIRIEPRKRVLSASATVNS